MGKNVRSDTDIVMGNVTPLHKKIKELEDELGKLKIKYRDVKIDYGDLLQSSHELRGLS